MASYDVTVQRSGRYWAVTVEGIGHTQARRLDELEEMTTELITLLTDDPDPAAAISYRYELPDSVEKHLSEAARLRHDAAGAQAAAAAELRAAASELHDQGLPLRDVGRLLGVSHQRAHQLVS